MEGGGCCSSMRRVAKLCELGRRDSPTVAQLYSRVYGQQPSGLFSMPYDLCALQSVYSVIRAAAVWVEISYISHVGLVLKTKGDELLRKKTKL